MESDAGGLRAAGRVALWMTIGAAQFVLFGLGAAITRPFSEARSVRCQLAAVGGAGKLLWWRRKTRRKE